MEQANAVAFNHTDNTRPAETSFDRANRTTLAVRDSEAGERLEHDITLFIVDYDLVALATARRQAQRGQSTDHC